MTARTASFESDSTPAGSPGGLEYAHAEAAAENCCSAEDEAASMRGSAPTQAASAEAMRALWCSCVPECPRWPAPCPVAQQTALPAAGRWCFGLSQRRANARAYPGRARQLFAARTEAVQETEAHHPARTAAQAQRAELPRPIPRSSASPALLQGPATALSPQSTSLSAPHCPRADQAAARVRRAAPAPCRCGAPNLRWLRPVAMQATPLQQDQP